MKLDKTLDGGVRGPFNTSELRQEKNRWLNLVITRSKPGAEVGVMAVSAAAIEAQKTAAAKTRRWPWWGSAVTLGALVMFWLGQAFPHLPLVPEAVSGLQQFVTGPFVWLQAANDSYSGVAMLVAAGQLLWAVILATVLVLFRKHLIPTVVWVVSLWIGSYTRLSAIPGALGQGWASLWQEWLRDRPELGAVVVGTLLLVALYPTGRTKHWMEIVAAAATVLVLLAWPNPVVLLGIVPMVAVYVHHLGFRETFQRLQRAASRMFRAVGGFMGELHEQWAEREEVEASHAPAALPVQAAGAVARCSSVYLSRVLARGGWAWLRLLVANFILIVALFELAPGARTELLLLGSSLLFASLAFAKGWRFSASVAFYCFVAAVVAWPPGPLPLVIFALLKASAWVIGSLAVLVEIEDAAGFEDYVRENQLEGALADLRAETTSRATGPHSPPRASSEEFKRPSDIGTVGTVPAATADLRWNWPRKAEYGEAENTER